MEMDHRVVGVSESPDTKQLAEALAKAQAEFKPVRKSAENKFAGFRYPTYGDMAQATYPALSKHGLAVQFQQGFWGGREVLIGRLRHKTGEWVSSAAPLHYPTRKGGEAQIDGQGLEVANAYAKKALIMQLTGAWLEGDEPEVAQDQVAKEVREIGEAGSKPAAPKPTGEGNYFKTLEARMKAVRQMPEKLEQYFRDAEKLAEEGDLTADHLARLNRQFGALRPRKEVANVVDG